MCNVDDLSSDYSVACVWSVCVARKAPLVASDSSSSNSSDSDEEEGKKEPAASQTVTMETVTTRAGKETLRLTVDAKNERAFFSRYARAAPPLSPCPSFGFSESHFPFPPPNLPSHNPTSTSSVCLLLLPSFCLFPPFTSHTRRVFKPAVRRYVLQKLFVLIACCIDQDAVLWFFHAVFQVWGSAHVPLEQQRQLHDSSQLTLLFIYFF